MSSKLPDYQKDGSGSVRSCVVVGDFPDERSGELHAAIAGIAEQLALAEGGATLLCVESSKGKVADRLRQALPEDPAIDLVSLPPSSELLPGLNSPAKRSIATYHYLRQQRFRAIYFALEGGLPYYSLLAKETGTYRNAPQIHLIAQSPTAWTAEADKRFLENTAEVAAVHMERHSLAAGDGLICSSQAILDWMRQKQWKLPIDTDVIHPPVPSAWRQRSQNYSSPVRKPNELVFLSGPEYHKGLTLLCDALDSVAGEPDIELTVTMIGPFGRTLGEHTGGMVLRKAREWPFQIKLLPQMSPQECLSYLHTHPALTVFPAYASGTNLGIAACLEHSLPFVATNAGSTAELLSAESQQNFLCDPTAKALGQKIVAVVREGASAATPSTHLKESADSWTRYFSGVATPEESGRAPLKSIPASHDQPLVSVVLVHHDRPKCLMQAVASIEQQDYQNLELILVDDGSTLSESHAAFETLGPRFARKGWKILREKNRYLGAARNIGARAARGKYILFLDDDNALFRSAISTLVRAAQICGADICTCFRKTFYGETIPVDEHAGFIQYTPLGGSLDIGFIENLLGDATALIRREVFDRIGYQIELFGRTGEDWEFYARALLEGQKLRLVPEPLYWYRSSVRGMLRTSHWYDNRQPTLDTFRGHGFQGLEYLYHLALSSHVQQLDMDRLYDNLHFSPWDSKFLKLSRLDDPQSDEALDLLADIAASEGRAETASNLGRYGNRGDPPARPAGRYARPSTRSRTFECSPQDFARARLGSSYPSDLPQLLFPKEGGLFLRPSDMGPVVAVLDNGFPPFAQRAIGYVEIAHKEASPFDFAMALTRSDQTADWSSNVPGNCIAFSGWRRVEDRFKLHEIALEVAQLAIIPFTINMAIRLPQTSNVSPSNAFWRKLVFEWDKRTP